MSKHIPVEGEEERKSNQGSSGAEVLHRLHEKVKKEGRESTFRSPNQAEEDEKGGDSGGEGGLLEHPDYQALEEKLNEAEEKSNEHWNQVLRLKAEIDNLNRRAERDVANAHKYAIEKLLLDLLPLLDSIEKGLETEVNPEDKLAVGLHKGMELVHAMMLKTLAKFNVKQIDPLGETFNPDYHEAISVQKEPRANPNTVVNVLQKGYLLYERLIRPALVVVAG